MKTSILTSIIFLLTFSMSSAQESHSEQLAYQSNVEKTNPWDINKIDEGQIVDLADVNFEMDEATLTEASKIVLNDLVEFMLTNKTLKIELRGHTNNTPPTAYCDELSTNRAEAVKTYLIAQGVNQDNIIAKGYGKRVPRSDNLSYEGRMSNQRVDVKILSL